MASSRQAAESEAEALLEAGVTRRVSLSRSRIGYERRIWLWLAALVLPSLVCVSVFVAHETGSWLFGSLAALGVAAAYAFAALAFFDQLVRPLQTLANVVAALREDDFSFRARGALRGDSLGDLALEINTLASLLQNQRSAARDALTLVERVMTAMQTPVLAFDSSGHLRLINPAAETAFHLSRTEVLGLSANAVDLETLLDTADEGLYTGETAELLQSTAAVRWSVRRTTFRLHGVPHTLFVLTDVAAALREEERLAWQRLIRVLSHEINNSLTPIKSLAGSLRSRLSSLPESTPANIAADLNRGLYVIEERSASLNRFLQAYQQLTRLPPPTLRVIELGPLLEQVAHLETRLHITVEAGPTVHLCGDPDQLQQLLINLIRNAVEAAMSEGHTDPAVALGWSITGSFVAIAIRDNGPGIGNPANLFVPFYTTKPQGSGIGLVLAQQIASAHKGSIALANNLNAPGCTAELRLPIEPA